jgi:hypothetical protein
LTFTDKTPPLASEKSNRHKKKKRRRRRRRREKQRIRRTNTSKRKGYPYGNNHCTRDNLSMRSLIAGKLNLNHCLFS